MCPKYSDAASCRLLGLLAAGLSVALFVLIAFLGMGGFHLTV